MSFFSGFLQLGVAYSTGGGKGEGGGVRAASKISAVGVASPYNQLCSAFELSLWSDEAVVGAMKAVKEGRMSVNRSALEFGVPRTTLKDRIAGRVVHGTNIGPKKYLSQEEEQELVNFLIKCSKIGYGKTRGEVLKIVEAAVKKKGRVSIDRISQGWWIRFRERWPNLSLTKGLYVKYYVIACLIDVAD